MKKVVFYRDDNDTFECNVKVNGSSLNNTKARMIFEFSDRNYVFNGSVHKDGLITVDIPKLNEINEKSGDAVLEVIVDSLLFTPWKSSFKLEDKNDVMVEGVSINKKSDVSLVLESVNTTDESGEMLTETCTNKNRGIIANILNENADYSQVEFYIPSDNITEWLKNNFSNPESTEARYCGYVLEERIERKKRK